MTHQRTRRHAPLARVALLSLLLAALASLAAGAHAAPARQADGTPQPTSPAPSPTPEPTTPAPSPTLQPSPAAPSATATTGAAPADAGSPEAAPAQAVSLAISKTLVGSDVVQVGQYLTFTIQITNTGAAVVTDLPLVDEYETSILQPAAGTTPPPTNSAPGVLRWADLTDTFGDLAPGASISVTAVFRAIRIDDEVINRARVEAGSGSGGGGGAPFEDQAGGAVEGGHVIVEKALVESFINLDTPVISFTVSLRNDSFADIVTAPVVDSYRADLLSFISASVPPDAHDPITGELRWDNLLDGLGVARLRPQETVSFTTVFSVTGAIQDVMVNSADTGEVRDEFGNHVASPRRAEVRIRVAGPGADITTTPTPQEEHRPRRTPTPALTSTPTADGGLTATPAGTATATTTTAETTLTATAEAAVTVAATPDSTSAGAGATAPTTLPATGAPARPRLLWGLALLAIAAGLAVRGAGRGRGR